MPISVSLYNHTALRFANGANSASDSYRLMLCTSATFNATNTTLASITKTQVANGTGYSAPGALLSGVAINTVNTNDAAFVANDVTWAASGGSISASYAILYNDTDTDDPPVLFIDFGGTKTASSGSNFLVTWNSSGIVKFNVD